MATHHASEADFYQCLGEIMVRWNGCEAHLRDLIIWLCGGQSAVSLALTAHMSAKALTDALPALTGTKDAEVREHLEHYTKAVDILRTHRNYYIHGIADVGPSMITGSVAARVSQVTGRKRVKLTFDHLDTEPLLKLLADLRALQEYGRRIQMACVPNYGRGLLRPYKPLAAWPSKPPLPAELKRPSPILIGAPPDERIVG